jgi:hypothetical protein
MLFVVSCHGKKENAGDNISVPILEDTYAYPVLEDVDPEKKSEGIDTSVSRDRVLEAEHQDNSEFDFFLGKWLRVDTVYNQYACLYINDGENNAYIDIYEEDGKYRIKIKEKIGPGEGPCETGTLSKNPAGELSHYSDNIIYINCDDGDTYGLWTQAKWILTDNKEPVSIYDTLTRNAALLGRDSFIHGQRIAIYQRKEVIDNLISQYGELKPGNIDYANKEDKSGGYASSTPGNINPTEDTEMDYFLGRWLAIYTYDIPSMPFINDEENNSYIDIYKENGVYRVKMRRFFGGEWEYSTGTLLKEVAHTSPVYFDPEEYMFISLDTGAILSLKRRTDRYSGTDEGLNALLYHNSIYLDHDVEQYFYQRKEVIDDFVKEYGDLRLEW